MRHRRQETPDDDRADQHEGGEGQERQPPAEQVAGRGGDRNPEHEREGSARHGDGDRAADLFPRYEVRGVGADDGPEQTVGHAADDAPAHHERVVGGDGGEHIADREDQEHQHDQTVPGQAAGEVGE